MDLIKCDKCQIIHSPSETCPTLKLMTRPDAHLGGVRD